MTQDPLASINGSSPSRRRRGLPSVSQSEQCVSKSCLGRCAREPVVWKKRSLSMSNSTKPQPAMHPPLDRGSSSFAGKTVLILGGNAGLGRSAAEEFAQRGVRVIILGRSKERGEQAVTQIKSATGNPEIHLLVADMSSMGSLRAAADQLLSRFDALHAILCNAAIPGYDPTVCQERTGEGHNKLFAANYLGHYLMTRLLLSLLLQSGGRVVFIAAPQMVYRTPPDLDDLRFRQKDAWKSVYVAAKIACFCMAMELTRRHPSMPVAIIDPGIIETDFQKDAPLIMGVMVKLGLFRNTADAVGKLYAWLSLAPSIQEDVDIRGQNGRLWTTRREVPLKRDRDHLVFAGRTLDRAYQARLWDESARCVDLTS
ncbi:MAG: SDR family NAD(P)-dependent oxidoreductase [Hyphomicrobiaceae bacterium]